ncbi:shikimate kinase [Pseudoprimorskyibacter insulae]|uniref:Shikimate kinase n=1 Tax=Pseudoprimorskyibacter insulae TaxID=1695997 RepID=A0A2R8AWH1_9RHOB|nr:shikimate kinase [Pseudoprimorskyibacter insulae]SPF80383.1 Shikimate kinase 1 [Pseudoprimorskyibacter insulae]
MKAKVSKTIVMVGMMGAGKTAVGKALAAALGIPFIDSDQEIEKAANMTIAEIFARDGEPFFRKKESQVIDRLLAGPPCILSAGGGAYVDPANRKMISERAVAVWLNADLEVLWNRVRHKTTRPLLKAANPKQVLSDLLDKRIPTYAQAEIAVRAEPAYSIEDTTGAVIEALRQRPDVVEFSE